MTLSKYFSTDAKSLAFAYDRLAEGLETAALRASRKAAEAVADRYRETAPRQSGAMADSVKITDLEGGSFDVEVTQEDVMKRRAALGAKVPYDKKRGEAFFYPAVVEFSDAAPLRKAAAYCEENFKDAVVSEIRREVRQT